MNYMTFVKSHRISEARSVRAVSDIVTSAEVHMELLEIVVFDEADRQGMAGFPAHFNRAQNSESNAEGSWRWASDKNAWRSNVSNVSNVRSAW